MNLQTFDYQKNRLITAGRVEGNVFYKQVNRKRHYLWKMSGYAIQREIVSKLMELKIERIVITEKDGLSRWITLKDFLHYSRNWSGNHGQQLAIDEKFLIKEISCILKTQ